MTLMRRRISPKVRSIVGVPDAVLVLGGEAEIGGQAIGGSMSVESRHGQSAHHSLATGRVTRRARPNDVRYGVSHSGEATGHSRGRARGILLRAGPTRVVAHGGWHSGAG
jgi:hypothetical protein